MRNIWWENSHLLILWAWVAIWKTLLMFLHSQYNNFLRESITNLIVLSFGLCLGYESNYNTAVGYALILHYLCVQVAVRHGQSGQHVVLHVVISGVGLIDHRPVTWLRMRSCPDFVRMYSTYKSSLAGALVKANVQVGTRAKILI